MPDKKMVNNYEVLKSTPNINTLIRIGVISCHILSWIQMYEYYLDRRKSEKKMQAYEDTAENFNISSRQVMNLVNYMESKNHL
jgi:hypothetical protein